MFRLAAKSIAHTPQRLVLTAVAVALGVMLVGATQTFTASLSSGFGALFSEIYGGSDIVVEADPDAETEESADGPAGGFGAGEPLFTADDVAAVAALEGVATARGIQQVPASGFLAKGQDRADPSSLLGGPPTQVFSWTGDASIDRATVVEGSAPEADDEIVIDVDAIEALGYEIGDTLTVSTPTASGEFTIVGTVRFGQDNNLQGATLAYLSPDAAIALSGTEDFQSIGVVAEDGTDLDALALAVDAVLPDGTRAITGEAKAAEQSAGFDDALVYVDIVTIVFAIIALFVGSYIILNTFRIVVTQRTRELGLLRAIGMKGGQVLRMILLEAVLVAIVASTVGIALGWALAWAVVSIMTATGTDVFGALILPGSAIAWSYALGIAVTVLSALAPALRAARVSPMEALREAGTQSRAPLTVRNIAGGILSLAGLAAIVAGVTSGIAEPYWLVGIGGGVLVLGVTLLAAQVLVPLAFGLRGGLTRVFGVDGTLAANNIRQEPRRSANTAAALMIGVMLLALVATFAQSLKTVIDEQLGNTSAGAFVVSTQGPIPDEAVTSIRERPDIEVLSPVATVPAEVDGEPVTVSVIDPDSAVVIGGFTAEPGIEALGDGVFISPDVAATGVEVGDEVTLQTETASATFTVTGEYLSGAEGDYTITWGGAAALVDDLSPDRLAVVFTADAGADAAIDAFNDALLEDYPALVAFPPQVFASLISSLIDLILGVITALLSAALVIAVLGVANTLLLSVTERTREIGLLRAVGLRRGEVWRMITLESVIMAVFGAVVGMVLGVGIGAALVVSLKDLGFSTPAVPWEWLALYAVLAIIAGIVAAIWPAWRASRMDILQAIATDG